MRPSYLESNFNCSGDILIRGIRKLAKSSYWQTVFSYAKELHFPMFNNVMDFSDLQILLLNYISFYSSLNLDVAIGDVTDIVFENELYEDAYMHYKQKVDKKKIADRPKNNQPVQSSKEENSPQVNWVFKKPKKV